MAKTIPSQQTVCAVTVAYNDPDELNRLLESISAQTRPVDCVIVVDNSDESLLSDRNSVVTDSALCEISNFEFVKSPVNRGSAGGFKMGMALAYARNYDWIWLLDQDGIAAKDCLKKLLESSGKAGILCPKVLSIGDESAELYFRGRLNFLGGSFPVFSCPGKELSITLFATHGVMISRAAISETGYYDDRNFFCGWEDHDYSQRLKKNGIKMLLVSDAVVYHPDLIAKYKKTKAGRFHWTSLLYMFVNSHLPLPAFLGVVTKTDMSTELGVIRKKTLVALTKKHIRGFKFWAAFIFSFFCLVVMKVSGKPVLFVDSLKMYADMTRD
ncbi:MAG: glycosyltransferase [Synergistaceae bacterium]|jgi:rhamnopyranosyl-N-acetylglucosaminyl-diphospho-decaprenol beta-1,3/1,4-galactofuranosyltransferase|nr:glycosyltransferase [Synergistaceae bacterium]